MVLTHYVFANLKIIATLKIQQLAHWKGKIFSLPASLNEEVESDFMLQSHLWLSFVKFGGKRKIAFYIFIF